MFGLQQLRRWAAVVFAASATLSFSVTFAQTAGQSQPPQRSRQVAGQDQRQSKPTGDRGPANRPAARIAAAPSNNSRLGETGRFAAPPPPRNPQPPFQLTPNEQKIVDELLKCWEETNSRIKTFKCEFVECEYDETLAPTDPEYRKNENKRSEAKGVIKYKRPDQGAFKVEEMVEYNVNTHQYDPVKNHLEHWVCDGKAIYQFDPAAKELVVYSIPEEMRGNAIADGPVPFIFGSSAEKLKQRYWIRENTPKGLIGKATWLQIFPKFQHDAANFEMAVLTLNDVDFSISGVLTVTPGGVQKTTLYVFEHQNQRPLLKTKRRFYSASQTIRMEKNRQSFCRAARKGTTRQNYPRSPRSQTSQSSTLATLNEILNTVVGKELRKPSAQAQKLTVPPPRHNLSALT